MSDPIALLERLACEPYWDARDVDAFARPLPPEAGKALLARDAGALARALGTASVMVCAVAAPDDREPMPDEAPVRDEPESPDIPGEPD